MQPSTHNQLFDLHRYCFVVSGGSSGIGRAMAGFLLNAGARVVLVARRREALQQACEEFGGDSVCRAVVADLGDKANIDVIAGQCHNQFGRVDGVINAAGINLREPTEDITLQSWDQTLDLNLAAPFFLSRCFVDEMKQRGYGRIINIASLQSSRAFENGLAYGASKAGVCQLTRAMSRAWSRHGINCNAIAPGFFPTDLTSTVFNNSNTREWAANQTTIGRNGELDDLYGPTVFFASPASSYITGQTLYVDGGFTAQ